MKLAGIFLALNFRENMKGIPEGYRYKYTNVTLLLEKKKNHRTMLRSCAIIPSLVVTNEISVRVTVPR